MSEDDYSLEDLREAQRRDPEFFRKAIAKWLEETTESRRRFDKFEGHPRHVDYLPLWMWDLYDD